VENGSDYKKINEINETATRIVAQPSPRGDHESRIRARVLELELDKTKKEKKEYGPPETPPAYPRAGGHDDDDIPGLNGGTSVIVKQMATWLSPFTPDYKTSRTMIGNWVKQYGADAVRDGFADYCASMADDRVRVPTVKAVLGFIKTAYENRGRGRPRALQNRGGREGTYKPAYGSFAAEATKTRTTQQEIIIDVTPNEWSKS
jgi:hypothetical protein